MRIRLLLLLFLAAWPGWSQEALERSIVLLLDHSYSMSLYDPDSGLTRLQAAQRTLDGLLRDRKQPEEWALVTLQDSINMIKPFSRDTRGVANRLWALHPSGSTPLREALIAANRYLETQARGEQKILLLVSDCIDTEQHLLPDWTPPGGITFMVLGFRLPANRPLERLIRTWTAEIGGDFYTPSESAKLKRNLERINNPPLILSTITTLTVKREKVFLSRLRRGVLVAVSWAFLSAFILALLLAIRKGVRWGQVRQEARRLRARPPKYSFALEVRQTDGKKTTRIFKHFPIILGCGGKPDVPLPQLYKGRPKKPFHLRLERTGEQVLFKSPVAFIVNGVARKEKMLKPGDLINVGSYRIRFSGLEREDPRIPQSGRPVFVWYAPGLAVLMALFLVFRLEASTADIEEVEETQSKTVQVEKPEPLSKNLDPPPIPSSTVLHGLGRISALKPTRNEVQMVAPGEPLPAQRGDVLFIHAHPDDESLDFGALMARSAHAGKSLITVLFTDGESGLDEYPRRGSPVGYPDRAVEGSELSVLRVQEAKNALTELGASVYIRLGLRNHPYNGVADEKSLEQILEIWGGEAHLIATVIELIDHFQPLVVVSPDQHSEAREHFEHEAVGYIVRRALDMENPGTKGVQGHLVSVDPLQKHLYGDAVGLAALDPGKGLYWRTVQARALKAHRTQRDAAVIGLERLPNFAREYYQTRFWTLSESVESFFK